MPLLGLGVYRNDDCFAAVFAALRHGYRHVDSARMYGNEAEVGRAVRESGVPRSEVFVSECVDSRYGPLLNPPVSLEDLQCRAWL